MGHAERTCLIGLRLADAVGLESAQRSSLFYALLLKDAGCSTTAAQIADGVRHRRPAGQAREPPDRRAPPAHVARLPAAQRRPRRPAARARPPPARRRGDEPRRGRRARAHALRARRRHRARDRPRRGRRHRDRASSSSTGTATATRASTRGEEISLLARMACLAQTMEVFWQQGGAAAACDVARARRGTWFDPALVDAVGRARARRLLLGLARGARRAGRRARRPRRCAPTTRGLDRVAEAFAGIVDAKSPYTARHCAGVAEIADGIAATMGLDDATRRLLRRAALLHDIGKLGVSNRILDKPGPLTDGEWSAVRRHPRLSMVILRAVPALAPVARLSATHHERLDGSGYPYGLTASELKLPDRVLQVADVADALTAERPYREALLARRGAGHHALRRRQAPGRRRLRGRRVVAAPADRRGCPRRLMDIRLSEIVAALSHALDVTEGQPMGHAERTLRHRPAPRPTPSASSPSAARRCSTRCCSRTPAARQRRPSAELFGADDLSQARAQADRPRPCARCAHAPPRPHAPARRIAAAAPRARAQPSCAASAAPTSRA